MPSNPLWQILEPHGAVACVTSMWEGVQKGQSRTFLSIRRCTPRTMVHPFYGMRMIHKEETECLITINVSDSRWEGLIHRYPSFSILPNRMTAYFPPQDIQCVMNVQHNCWDAKCEVTHTKSHTVERTLVQHNRPEVSHQALNPYIINAAALYSAEQHRKDSALEWAPVSPYEWEEAVCEGLTRWLQSHPIPKQS